MPTIDLALGYKTSNQSPILKLLFSRLDELVARISKKARQGSECILASAIIEFLSQGAVVRCSNAAWERQHSAFAINRHSILPAKVRLAFLTGCPQHLPDLQARSSTHNGVHFDGKRVFRPSDIERESFDPTTV